jgi:beta-1,4-mannosyl-glycoprotein beta-1,4-N-acetylglucosaminyltransferase
MKNPLVSIVVPTYNHCKDLLAPCLESIRQYTDLENIEVIVVANGCVDETKKYVKSLGDPFKLVWFDAPMGYVLATDAGMHKARGEYIVLLNNDTVLTEQPKNDWIEKLIKPLREDATAGITGPMKVWNEQVQRDFIIFFCAAFRRSDAERVGYLDRTFGMGFFEDVDFACKIQNLGLKVVQVPAFTDNYAAEKVMSGDFPIIHKGHATFKDLPDEKRASWHVNEKTVTERYKYDLKLDRAKACDGYMGDTELAFLAKEARRHQVIIEVGSWHGRSTRALGDNTDGIVYAVDHFNGSATEPMNHGSARWENGDHAFMEFMRNNWDLIQKGKVVPLRGSSASMAKELKNLGVKADMIFIDGGHTYEEVKEDILLWIDLLDADGLYCGHDYGSWIGVTQAVDELITTSHIAPTTSIWTARKQNVRVAKPRVFDCFPFFNELDIVEMRMNILNDVVDYFVISEGNSTHSGKAKPYIFEQNKQRFEKFWDKIIYVKADLPKFEGDAWVLERYQRDCLMKGISEKARDGDILLISDCDEIPNPQIIRDYKPNQGLMGLDQKLYYYYLNCYQGNWNQAKILPYTLFKKGMSPCQVRYTEGAMIPNAGWHFSYIGSPQVVREKIEAFAHQEYNTDEQKAQVEARMERGEDVYGRNADGRFVEIDETYPQFIRDNIDRYKHLIKCM